MPPRAPARPATTVGGRITRVRQAAALSREELAVAIGRSHATIVSYELGRQVPRIRTLHVIAAALGTTAADLVEGTEAEGAS